MLVSRKLNVDTEKLQVQCPLTLKFEFWKSFLLFHMCVYAFPSLTFSWIGGATNGCFSFHSLVILCFIANVVY